MENEAAGIMEDRKVIMEKKVNSKTIYEGKVVTLTVDQILTDEGNEALREVVHHRGGCCIALQDPEDGKYFCVRQYRYAQGTEMLEFCAGKIEEGEDPAVTICRESEEELGYTVKDLKSYGYIVPTCGYSSEKIYLYSGIKGERVGTHFDEDEEIEEKKYSLEELKEMVCRGELYDAKTIALLWHLERSDV